MLFKKTAEVFPAEANTGRNIIQRKFFRVMFIDVSDDFPDRIIRSDREQQSFPGGSIQKNIESNQQASVKLCRRNA